MPSDAVPRLRAAWTSTDPELRRSALDALGYLAEVRRHPMPPGLAAEVITLAEDTVGRVRGEACCALALLPLEGSRDGHARVEALQVRLGDEAPAVRRDAMAALGDLAYVEVDISTAVDTLAQALGGPEPQRFEAAFALASAGDPRAFDPLAKALGTPSLRPHAVEALGRLNDARALPELDRVRKGWLVPWSDKLGAAAVAAAFGSEAAWEDVARAFRSRRFEVRIHACAVSAARTLTRALEPIRAIAARDQEPAREAALQALGKLGSREDLDFLERHAHDEAIESGIRRAAHEAAEAIRTTLRPPD